MELPTTTHWFQPLTGSTAEKHDAFFEPDSDGSAIEKFTADALVQQEPDASSFPNGGIRNTFEATEVIPHGIRLRLHLFSKQVEARPYVIPTVFLYPIAYRPLHYSDNISGKKVSSLEDHYFGAIPERVLAFMVDLENESLKLGIPLKTRHNEVAPSQFECAPMFEEINLAIDHNQLLQNIMDQVALRHSFKVLLHEKLTCQLIISGPKLQKQPDVPELLREYDQAVHEHADLLRAIYRKCEQCTVWVPNEAPTCDHFYLSLGSQLDELLEEVESARVAKKVKAEANLWHGIPKIPELRLDNTDRNRTSPFAFTVVLIAPAAFTYQNESDHECERNLKDLGLQKNIQLSAEPESNVSLKHANTILEEEKLCVRNVKKQCSGDGLPTPRERTCQRHIKTSVHSSTAMKPLTVLSYDPVNNKLSYKDEKGEENSLDISTLVKNNETLTTLAYNNSTKVLTYTDEKGLPTDINISSLVTGNETLTVLSYDPVNNKLIYKDEKGDENSLDISTLVKNNETLTKLAYDNISKILTYTDEKGLPTDINISSLVTGNETLTVLSYDPVNNKLIYKDEKGNENSLAKYAGQKQRNTHNFYNPPYFPCLQQFN
ncbi:hypothetical protein FQR65_LT17945 [Abscondita terminalis]|nr:hypothetical protein FQR65_LT17945 [Abscondita terminalis]